MADIAVLTGELLTTKALAHPKGFSQRLVSLLEELRASYPTQTVDFRDHGFQVALQRAELAPGCALFVRSGLLSASPSRRERWDARLSIAVAQRDDPHTDIYRQSGRGLGALERGNMRFFASPESLGIALDMATVFADDIVSHWTPSEAEAYFEHLRTPGGHKAIAERLHKSRPTITKTLLRARYNLLDRYRRDVRALIRLFPSG